MSNPNILTLRVILDCTRAAESQALTPLYLLKITIQSLSFLLIIRLLNYFGVNP